MTEAERVGTVVDPKFVAKLPYNFSFSDYMDIEREISMIHPSIGDRRANFYTEGCSAWLVIETPETGEPLADNELYLFMPTARNIMEMIRFVRVKRLTPDEFKVLSYTAVKMRDISLGDSFVQYAIEAGIAQAWES